MDKDVCDKYTVTLEHLYIHKGKELLRSSRPLRRERRKGEVVLRLWA